MDLNLIFLSKQGVTILKDFNNKSLILLSQLGYFFEQGPKIYS